MNSKKEKKTIVGLIVSIIALLMFTIGMTFAYFTASNSTTSSSMTFGTLNINTNGLTAGQKSTTCGSPAHTLVPGCTIDLSAPVSVTGNIDALLRAQLTATVFQTNGVDSNTNEAVKCKIENNRVVVDETNGTFYALKSEATSVSNEQNLSFAEQVFILANTASYSGWTYSDDGFYYYNKVVNGASVNAASFATSFTLPANTMGNDWQGAYVQFGIELQAIQAEHLVNANNKKITFTKDNNNVITSISVESGATITVGENNKTLEDVFGVINGVAAWEAVEPEGNNNNNNNNNNAPAPDEAPTLLANLSFTPNGQGTSDNNAQEMNSLNNINASNGALMNGGVTNTGSIGGLDIFDNVDNISPDGDFWKSNGDFIIPDYVLKDDSDHYYAYPNYDYSAFFEGLESNEVTILGTNYTVYIVTNIWGGFEEESLITSVTIPETITSIDSCAFNCSTLMTINFNAINCADLINDYENSDPDNCTIFYGLAYDSGQAGGEGATINIGPKVTRIPANFIHDYDYTPLYIDAINIHEDNHVLVSIGRYAFSGSTTSDTQTQITCNNIPASVTSIGIGAFSFSGGNEEWKTPSITLEDLTGWCAYSEEWDNDLGQYVISQEGESLTLTSENVTEALISTYSGYNWIKSQS